MPNKLKDVFLKLREEKKKAFIPFVTAGFPTIELTYQTIRFFNDNGADIIELGMPFSDPIADGVTIQTSSQIALNNKMNLSKLFKIVTDIRSDIKIPIVLLSYYNPIYKFGLNRFCIYMKNAGISGVVIPDIIPEESGEIREHLDDISLIYLLTPTTEKRRMEMIFQQTSSFVYIVSLTGTTGARSVLPSYLPIFLKNVRKLTNLPLVLGFGISKPYQIYPVLDYIDGIIIGSALVNIMLNTPKGQLFKKMSEFIKPFLRLLNKK